MAEKKIKNLLITATSVGRIESATVAPEILVAVAVVVVGKVGVADTAVINSVHHRIGAQAGQQRGVVLASVDGCVHKRPEAGLVVDV